MNVESRGGRQGATMARPSIRSVEARINIPVSRQHSEIRLPIQKSHFNLESPARIRPNKISAERRQLGTLPSKGVERTNATRKTFSKEDKADYAKNGYKSTAIHNKAYHPDRLHKGIVGKEKANDTRHMPYKETGNYHTHSFKEKTIYQKKVTPPVALRIESSMRQTTLHSEHRPQQKMPEIHQERTISSPSYIPRRLSQDSRPAQRVFINPEKKPAGNINRNSPVEQAYLATREKTRAENTHLLPQNTERISQVRNELSYLIKQSENTHTARRSDTQEQKKRVTEVTPIKKIKIYNPVSPQSFLEFTKTPENTEEIQVLVEKKGLAFVTLLLHLRGKEMPKPQVKTKKGLEAPISVQTAHLTEQKAHPLNYSETPQQLILLKRRESTIEKKIKEKTIKVLRAVQIQTKKEDEEEKKESGYIVDTKAAGARTMMSLGVALQTFFMRNPEQSSNGKELQARIPESAPGAAMSKLAQELNRTTDGSYDEWRGKIAEIGIVKNVLEAYNIMHALIALTPPVERVKYKPKSQVGWPDIFRVILGGKLEEQKAA